ncbi:MAG: YCF48-related protein [Candidatus Binatia bacterium]
MPRPGVVLSVCAALVLIGRPIGAGAAEVKDHLYGVKALSATEAWAVGNFGSIYHTTDGAKRWALVEWKPIEGKGALEKLRNPLFSIDFAGRSGWIVGKSSLIVHTGDAGATWAEQKSVLSTDKHLFKVVAVDDRTAWAVGDWGAVTVTHDGGLHWEDRSLSEDAVLNDVAFLDSLHGAIAGEFGTVLVTSDGGVTWEKRSTGTQKTLFGVHFVTPEKGWVVGLDGLLLHTVDGGGTWMVQHGVAEASTLEEFGFLDALRNPGFYAVRVLGEEGIVVGDTGTILTTADGGETWKRLELPAHDRLVWMRDVSLVSGTQGFAVGAAGFSVAIDRGTVKLPRGGEASVAAAP